MKLNQKNGKLLGILGGLGPASSVYFYELLTSHTHAERDADHINLILSSYASTPDRTAFVLDKSAEDPTPTMLRNIEMLTRAGAEVIAIPCNTAHYFYDRIVNSSSVPVINIIEETVKFAKHVGAGKIGILATDGTLASDAYGRTCKSHGIECISPNEAGQIKLMNIIYSKIKSGTFPERFDFLEIADELRARGADRVILGCTELSLLKKEFALDDFFVDSLEVLALKTILSCEKTPVGFSEELMEYAKEAAACSL